MRRPLGVITKRFDDSASRIVIPAVKITSF
jgi:hypothetical protein